MNIWHILQYGVHFLEAIALLASLIYIKKYIKTPSMLIPFYLSMVLIIETVGESLADDQWLYNLLGIAELIVFTCVFYFTVKKKVSKRIILVSFIVSALAIFIDVYFSTNTFFEFLSNAFAFVSLGITIMCFIFLLELAQTEKVIYINRNLLYWVVIGLLIFHVCNLPVTVFTNELLELGNVEELLFIQSIAAISMYICYTIGFIWSQKESHY